MAPLFQAREIPRIVPSLPPVKRLAADTEVATGQRRILSMPPVMVQPLQSCFCQPADPLDPAYDFGTRSSRTYYLHDDTILSVTHHYDREQGGYCGAHSLAPMCPRSQGTSGCLGGTHRMPGGGLFVRVGRPQECLLGEGPGPQVKAYWQSSGAEPPRNGDGG